MHALLTRHGFVWRNGEYLAAVAQGVFLLTIGLTVMMASRAYLVTSYVHAVTPPDLLLDILPPMRMENVLVWGVPILIGLCVAACSRYPERLPTVLRMTGFLFLVRAFFVQLTPMGLRPDQIGPTTDGFFQSIAYGSNDFFFSGHVSFPFLLALIFWHSPLFRTAMLGMSGLFAVAVLFAHTHYSIDVFAVPLIVPTLYRIGVYVFGDDAAWDPNSNRRMLRVSPSPAVSPLSS